MKKNQKRLAMVLLGVLVVLAAVGAVRSQFFSKPNEAPTAASASPAAGPTPGKVTMIDLGATECIPCKMMAPIIEELKKEYAGRADIIFIDVWKNPEQAMKYGIRAIPTQIFFDADGREVHRNTGFMDKKRIVEVLTRLGVS
ncbi:MAG: thioredoxin family protein [Desulfobacterales bacterium]